jgi:tRNA (cmo5U34)-methyltransferase
VAPQVKGLNWDSPDRGEYSVESGTEFNGEFSGAYDEKAKAIIPGYQVMYQLAQYLLEDKLGAQAKVLVAGVGTGREVLACSNANPEWSFVGFDPAEAMLQIAAKKLADKQLENKINLVHGLVTDVKQKAFDAATAILVMHFLPDDGTKQEFLNEISARLKPGSPLILIDLEGDPETDEYQMLKAAWKHQQLSTRDDPEQVSKEFEMRDRELNSVSQLRMEALFKEAGFTDIRKFYQAYLFAGYVATRPL